jgi:hypothetical protein
MPVLPFMVPSLIEAISHSQFARKAHVIPGEADEYCARFAEDQGGSVFTSDSDLLVYDLGEAGAVIMLKETEIHGTKGGSQLRLKKYQTSQIARKLGLDSLQPLAFAIQEDHYRDLESCIQHSRKLASHSTREFEHFVMQYSLPEQFSPGLDQRMSGALERLDPRTSEWITQVLNEKIGPQPFDGTQHSFDMFLPFLIEDPARSSAWETGTDIRILAYSIMCPSRSRTHTTLEYARKGARITSKTVDHMVPSAVENYIAEWCRLWDATSKATVGMIAWRLMGLHSLCQQLLQSEKPLPNRHSIYALLSGKMALPDWEYLHLSAHFQAGLYSWRMLYQVTSVLKVTPSSHIIMEDMDTTHITRLNKSFPDIPQIQELFTVTEGISGDQLDAYIGIVYELLGVQENVSSPAAMETRKRRRKKRDIKYHDSPNAKAKAKTSTPSFSTSNMYDLLSPTE